MTDLTLWVFFVLSLWIASHTLTQENPLVNGAGKPLECQLCISGWASILLFLAHLANLRPWAAVPSDTWLAALFYGAGWSGAVLVEAIYRRWGTLIL